MTPIYVARETLYASWNRGLAATEAPYFTFWNADDFRQSDALREGYRAMQKGATLVDFDYTRVSSVKRFGLFPQERRIHVPCMFTGDGLTRRSGIGPFFMASRSLIEQVGRLRPQFSRSPAIPSGRAERRLMPSSIAGKPRAATSSFTAAT